MFRKFGVSKHKGGGYKKVHITATTMELDNWFNGKLVLYL